MRWIQFGLLAVCVAGNSLAVWGAEASVDGAAAAQQEVTLDTQVPVHLRYLLYLPPTYSETREPWPLLLFLHGAGERGDDLNVVKVHGPPKLIQQGKAFPMIIASPQCPKNENWQAFKLLALIDDLSQRYRVDPDRIYVSGLSMGGYGTWELAAYAPNRLAAIVPICGGGEPFWTRRYAHLSVWAFHGANDTAVPLQRSQEMIAGLQVHGALPRFTIYPDADHDSWTATYENPQLYDWLLAQRRVPQR